MAVFTPINPPAAPKAEYDSDTSKSASLVRMEEEIQRVVHGYKAALRQWADGRLSEAYTGFKGLSEEEVLFGEQEGGVEGECDAYCKEFGGMSIRRLRALVSANAGELETERVSTRYTWRYTGRLNIHGLNELAVDMDQRTRLKFDKTLMRLQKALKLDSSNTMYYFAMGQYAMALGQHDIGLLAFQRALGVNNTHERLEYQRRAGQLFHKWRPLQWWSARAAVQAALLRGDVDVACNLISSASRQSRQQAQVLQQIVDGIVVKEVHARIICTQGVRREDSNTKCIAGPCNAVTVRAIDGKILLAAMGEAVLAFYHQTAMEDMVTGSKRLLEQVAFAIDANGCEAAPVEIACVDAVGGRSRVEGESWCMERAGASQAMAGADGQGSSDTSNMEQGKGDNGSNEERGGHKRQSSSSGDDMPVKRRSTRFIERTSSNIVPGVHGMGGSGTGGVVAGGRAAGTRNGARQGLWMTPVPVDSEAFRQGYDVASKWFETIGAMSREEFADAFKRSNSVMDTCSRQRLASRGRRSQSHGGREGDCTVVLDWCLHMGSSGDGDSVAAVLRTIEEMDGKCDTLSGPHICSLAWACEGGPGETETSRRDWVSKENPESAKSSPQPMVSIGDCQEVFQANGSIFEVLVKFLDKAVVVFASAPMEFLQSGRLRHATQQTVWIVHEMLVAQAAAGLCEGKQTAGWLQAVDCGTLVLALLAEELADGGVRRDINGHMRNEWLVLVGRAIAGQLPADSDVAVARYRTVEAWTDYEIAAAQNDAVRAAGSLARCLSWLQGFCGDAGLIAAARCTHSGAIVTTEVVRQRQAQVAQWVQFREALQAARSDAGRAAALLGSLAQASLDGAACALGFAQQVVAARLLAALHRQLGQAAAAGAAALHEARLYVVRLLDCSSDTQAPMRMAIGRCAECLRAVHLADVSLDMADVAGRRVAAQLVALVLAVTQRFPADPATEGPGDSPEAEFVGLGAWLGARLTDDVDRQLQSASEDANHGLDQSSDQGSDQISPHFSDHIPGDGLAPFDRFVSSIHEVLGERGLCTAADGAFLKLVVAARARGTRDPAKAALRCLFDIRLHSCSGERHNSAAVEMDHSAANAAYRLVATEVEEWLHGRRGSGLRGDLRAVVERASHALADVDVGRLPRVALNMDAIDEFLDGAAMPTFAQLASTLRGAGTLPLGCVAPRSTGAVPVACLELPFARAAAQHDVLRQRMRAGLPRAVEEYDDILEDYKLHASLHPESSAPWLALAQAHADLADELLLGTAAEVVECRHDIAALLRSALVCVALAFQLLPRTVFCSTLYARVYALAGSLLFRVAARPLPLLALRVLPSNVLTADNAQDNYHEWDVGRWRLSRARPAALALALARRYSTPPPARHVYALAHAMLLRASRLDPVAWVSVYMLGKATAKLGAPLAACALYLKACYLASTATGSGTTATLDPAALGAAVPEAAADALCKLLSTLTKLLWTRQIDAATVGRFLDALPFAPDGDEPSSRVSPSLEPDTLVPGNIEPGTFEPTASTHATLEPDVRQTFAAIRAMLELACPPDRRRWHHRAVFLLAWLDYHVFGAAERAKQALLPLLQMRAAGKQLASFYKPNSEAPGKHYLYLQKYLCLFIELLVSTCDLDGLHLLVRKLRRSPDSFYNHSAMLRRASEAEVDMLQLMVCRLNCPRYAVDAAGKEHIVLQHALRAARGVESHSVFRHCRLNRSQFNYARDFARENIESFSALRQRLRTALAIPEDSVLNGQAPRECGSGPAKDHNPAPEEDHGPAIEELCHPAPDNTDAVPDDLDYMLQAFDRHLEMADRALALFGLLLDQKKKHADDPELLLRLCDCMADLYVLVLSVYGQSRCAACLPPLHEHSLPALARACRDAADLLNRAPHMSRPDAAFWHCVIFDEARHESSQQYKLLDPLLEFHVNKLLDSVHEACAQPQPALRPHTPP
ncbi:Histone transcription regulator 3 [Coemansia sp. RSA 1365]|nr:Histone transcription regulator 3 [Coemansia sp. RSA 1365]